MINNKFNPLNIYNYGNNTSSNEDPGLKIQDYKDREVQMVSYEFDQETDREGQMTGIPRFQMLRVRVKALNDGTPELMAWMCDRFLKKDGEIQFLETKTLKVMKTIKFTGAYTRRFLSLVRTLRSAL